MDPHSAAALINWGCRSKQPLLSKGKMH